MTGEQELEVEGRKSSEAGFVESRYVDLRLGLDEELVPSFTSGYSLLNPTRPDTGSTDSTYRLRINVEPATLEPTES